jgi:hypothetical protein
MVEDSRETRALKLEVRRLKEEVLAARVDLNKLQSKCELIRSEAVQEKDNVICGFQKEINIRGSSERIWVTGEPQSQSQPKVWSTKRQRDRGRGGCCSIPLLRHYGVRVKFIHIEIRYL